MYLALNSLFRTTPWSVRLDVRLDVTLCHDIVYSRAGMCVCSCLRSRSLARLSSSAVHGENAERTCRCPLMLAGITSNMKVKFLFSDLLLYRLSMKILGRFSDNSDYTRISSVRVYISFRYDKPLRSIASAVVLASLTFVGVLSFF